MVGPGPLRLPDNFHQPDLLSDLKTADDTPINSTVAQSAWKEGAAPSRSCPIYDLSENDSILGDSESSDVSPRSAEVFDVDWDKLTLDIVEKCQGSAEDQSSFTLSPARRHSI